jgi:hypothetical protein
VVALIVFSAVGAAAGAVVTGPGFNAEVKTTVAPSRLPAHEGAPVTVTAEGSISSTESQGFPPLLKTITLSLDPQLAIDTTGLPVCKPADLLGHALAQARQECKAALVGSGAMTQQLFYPERPPTTLKDSVLFFNGAAAHVVMYVYVPPPEGPAAFVATGTARGQTLELRLPSSAGVVPSFQFRLGRTWHYHGEQHSYLSGHCSTGTIRNKLTLALVNGNTGTKSNMSDATLQRCSTS